MGVRLPYPSLVQKQNNVKPAICLLFAMKIFQRPFGRLKIFHGSRAAHLIRFSIILTENKNVQLRLNVFCV